MTDDEFQKKYHDYMTENKDEAVSEANKVNLLMTDSKVFPVKIGERYCLMLEKSKSFIDDIDLI